MNSLEQNLELIQENVGKLLDNYRFLLDENKQLIALMSSLEIRNEELINEKKILEEDYNVLKAAKYIEITNQDKKETKQKINEMIQEIDSCINQLTE